MLVPFGHIQPIEPGRLGGAGVVKEKDIGGDRGIGRKDAARHPNDGVKVELAEQLLFDIQFGVVSAEQKAVRQDHRRPSAGLEPVHDNRHEQVSGFAAGQIGRKVVFHVRFLAAAVGRIH